MYWCFASKETILCFFTLILIDVSHPDWSKINKHIFILSEAGKPIYSRYGNEEKLVTIMGVMQALVSFVQDSDDTLQSLVAGNRKYVFLVKGPLILVAVSSLEDSVPQLQLQLTYVYHQILSVLTGAQLEKIFEQLRNYDLRKLLGGTEKFLHNLLDMMDRDPSFFLESVQCLPIPVHYRDSIASSLQHAKTKSLVFAILITENQLITLVRPKKYNLHPADLHLIINLVNASTSFQSCESWLPICLPKFNDSGYLHAHISYLSEECPACLVLLSTDKDAFYELAESREKIIKRLTVKSNCIPVISEAITTNKYGLDYIIGSEIWHFLYKSKTYGQFVSPKCRPPYNTVEEQTRLQELYKYLHHRMHASAKPLKLVYRLRSQEALLGWISETFELYAVFNPLVSKTVAIGNVKRLMAIIKQEEDKLFIVNARTF
ncbi:uncharacterized protein TRIADDRAFT_22109 [Trichoplax adhaerens]|uniref:Vacuolar fusion protein MON1 homolog n=1 Tax=Trichoplax adhaerens TaxID=10228 RepID=B3RT37_TRIAD|nr:hypothetical protein TRIADDRAFT_22109 [Trichoplax adhaerens]EDV26624.1 hypothetical protein TRIADDRAFT_22109 [Trichoplax adhaerens]|eukprot:XP_002110620.1 hypothetical protein TRIADDRAFT_22109 [Trichoplax adhaerens]